jgi:peroxiredoxin
MARLETPECDFGRPAPDFSLPGVDGQTWTLEQCRGEHGTLVMFICNHCPFVKAVLDRIVRDARELQDAGVKSVAIMPNDTEAYPEDAFDKMQALAEEYDFPFPYLIDETQETARLYGAVCTPDFFGFNNELKLQYRGRIDGAGRDQPGPDTERELYNAMKRIAHTGAGPEPEDQFPSMGCSTARPPEAAIQALYLRGRPSSPRSSQSATTLPNTIAGPSAVAATRRAFQASQSRMKAGRSQASPRK